ncbi:ABC-2 transporter permease [Paenibacillaceae bacterium WGS1546]|uniref:ABC-2 transporter permease n=1 Tax=Cohnella sp. WGS1546 TaxID=3366810 RepID=UPI00372CF3BD
MLYHLVKKDLLLAKKYWMILLIAAIVLPAFIHTKLMAGGEFPSFFLSTLFIVYLLFNSVSMAEDKFRGAAYLCATPYTRKKLVIAKYMMIALLFLGCYLLYTLMALFGPIEMRLLNLYEFGLAILILDLAFGVIIPVQYRFGYEKSRYIFFFMIFITPFVMPNVIKGLQNSSIDLTVIPISQPVQGLLFVLLAFAIGAISLSLSIRIYASHDL